MRLSILTLALMIFLAGCASTAPTLAPSFTPPAPTPVPTLRATKRPPAPTFILEATTAASRQTPSSSSVSASPTPASPPITFSADGRYAFPVAGDLGLMTWTHYHWDGSNAVDVEAARYIAGDSDEFKAFVQLPVTAVVSGTVKIADNQYGGLALLLYGDDGYTYYYGHLSEQWVIEGQIVGVGDWLGRIGNTGYNTQYIEPHLHFSIATHFTDNTRWDPDVNAAEQFLAWFDLPWHDLDIPDYPADNVAGWPLSVASEISRTFSEPSALNPDQGSIELLPAVAGADPIPVFATLGGEVNVNRATVMGLRTQITNRPARTTVVFSFLLETTVTDGDVVRRGDLIGYIDPAIGLNYMLFVHDVSTDPVPTLGDPP